MISLTTPRSPFDLELIDGLTVTVKPLTSVGYLTATLIAQKKRDDLAKSLADVRDAGLHVDTDLDLTDPQTRQAVYLDFLIKELAIAHITAWDGVWDEESDQPADLTPERISCVMDIAICAESFFHQLTRWIQLLNDAKERLQRLTAWHFKKGGGPSYCGTCKTQDIRCGFENLCPYQRYAPQLLQERQAWELLQDCQSQFKLSPTGQVLGLDMPALLSIVSARGWDAEILSDLLKAGEAGLLEAMAENTDKKENG